MKTLKFENSRIKFENNKISRFSNNAIVKTLVAKIKGGEGEIVITEDCVDM